VAHNRREKEKKAMMLSILKIAHVTFGLIAIGSGVVVLFAMLIGKLLERWTAVFLKSTLGACVTGLLFPLHHFLPTHWSAMLAIYVAEVSVLAWRKFDLAGGWALTFALSIIFILCLNILVAIMHCFEYLPVFRMLSSTQPILLFLITESTVILLFIGLGLFAVRRYFNR
jgi:hypothetical protein